MLPCFARRTSPEAAAMHRHRGPRRALPAPAYKGSLIGCRPSVCRKAQQKQIQSTAWHWVLGRRASSPQLPLGDPLRVEFLTFFMGVGVLQHGHPRRGIVLATRDAQSKVDRQGPTCGR
jgi:hypothetical protein